VSAGISQGFDFREENSVLEKTKPDESDNLTQSAPWLEPWGAIHTTNRSSDMNTQEHTTKEYKNNFIFGDPGFRLQLLVNSADRSCHWRGHRMHYRTVHAHVVVGECMNCHKRVYVTDRPAPNDIDISGEAVALNCGGA
jgi:hypothetical protein